MLKYSPDATCGIAEPHAVHCAITIHMATRLIADSAPLARGGGNPAPMWIGARRGRLGVYGVGYSSAAVHFLHRMLAVYFAATPCMIRMPGERVVPSIKIIRPRFTNWPRVASVSPTSVISATPSASTV